MWPGFHGGLFQRGKRPYDHIAIEAGLREGAALIYDDRVTAVVFVSEETGIDERLIGLSLNDRTEQATMPRDLRITRSALAAVIETMQDDNAGRTRLTGEFDRVVDHSYLDARSSSARHPFDPIRRPR
jgi:hypothetical protein